MSLHLKSVTQLRAGLMDGLISCEDLVRDCLEQISATDQIVQAWAHISPEEVLSQARERDEQRQQGRPLGVLHGIPVGIKDIIDTAEMPTAHGSVIHDGRLPDHDATLVAKLKEAGAVIMGKTVTAEFAVMTPGKTTNPHNPDHTPGGSSSGSAAAVAAGQVPLAVGSQTNGSVIRPASYCGIFGLKPSQGMISRSGVLQTSQTLDQIGVFSRHLEDAALLVDALSGYDAADAATYARPKPSLLSGCHEAVPVEPCFAYFNLPFADRMSEEACAVFAQLRENLAGVIEVIDLPPSFANIVEHHRIIHRYELRQNLSWELAEHGQEISPSLRQVLEQGAGFSDDQYTDSLGAIAVAKEYFEEFFHDFDAIVTPSAAGAAPPGLAATGDPVFSTLWTFCGLPCLSLPLLQGAKDLPIGVQLVSALEDDARLCRTANWFLSYLADAETVD